MVAEEKTEDPARTAATATEAMGTTEIKAPDELLPISTSYDMEDFWRQEMDQLLEDNARLTAQNRSYLQELAKFKESSKDTNTQSETSAEESTAELRETLQSLEERIVSLVQEKLLLQRTVDGLRNKVDALASASSSSGAPNLSSRWLGSLRSSTSSDYQPPSPSKASSSDFEQQQQVLETLNETVNNNDAAPPPPGSQAEILAAALSKKKESSRSMNPFSGLFSTSSSELSPQRSPRSPIPTTAQKTNLSQFHASTTTTMSGGGSIMSNVVAAVVGGGNDDDATNIRHDLEEYRKQHPKANGASSTTEDHSSKAESSTAWGLMKELSVSKLFETSKEEAEDDKAMTNSQKQHEDPALMGQSKFLEAAIQNKQQRKRNTLF